MCSGLAFNPVNLLMSLANLKEPMAERNERPVFEGKNRRLGNRRGVDRRKSSRTITMWKYVAIALFIVVFIVAFSV
jgi:hypothetical protein